jgi:hypothetical protein
MNLHSVAAGLRRVLQGAGTTAASLGREATLYYSVSGEIRQIREKSGYWLMLSSTGIFCWWYTSAMLHSIGHALATVLIVLGVIALRLLLPSPLTDKYVIQYLPKSWRRWLLDKPQPSAKERA